MKLLRNTLARRKVRRRIAKRVKACFDGVDLTRHGFTFGAVRAQTPGGDQAFYSAREVDVAIGRINELISKLSS